MDFDSFVERFGPHLEHLRHAIHKVERAEQGVAQWQDRYKVALREVDDHVKHCGPCMALMIDTDSFIRLDEWWRLSHKMGRCDHPRSWDMRN